MKQSDFLSHVEGGSIAPVYLFTGEADFPMEEAWRRLVEKIVPPGARHFNGERLSAKEYTSMQVVARICNLPMFGSKQLLMVQNVEAWTKEQRVHLLAYLARPNPASCLVLTSSHKKGLEKLSDAVFAVGVVVDFPALSERDAPGWLQDRAGRHHGKTLTLQAAVFLVEQVGTEMHSLMVELEKLSAYTGDREKIETEDVRQIVGAHRSFPVFDLIRYIGQGQTRKSVNCLRKLMSAGEAPLAILGLLARQVRILWQVKDAIERGLSAQQMGKQLNLYGAVLKSYMQQVSLFSVDDLRRMHRSLRETDLALKSTGTSPEVMLEALVLKLCLNKQKSL
ncbi:MAG: DNA polymerase III subunit delta [Syntrophobacteraceae bacterium]